MTGKTFCFINRNASSLYIIPSWFRLIQNAMLVVKGREIVDSHIASIVNLVKRLGRSASDVCLKTIHEYPSRIIRPSQDSRKDSH